MDLPREPVLALVQLLALLALPALPALPALLWWPVPEGGAMSNPRGLKAVQKVLGWRRVVRLQAMFIAFSLTSNLPWTMNSSSAPVS